MPTIGRHAGEPDALDDPEMDGGDPGPRLFVRAITTLPSTPWDQVSAARLEARLNAPLPLDQVTFVVRRLTSWRPGSASEYAAVYARHEDVAGGLVTTAYLDGRPISVVFPAPGRKLRQARRLGVGVAVGAVAVIMVIATIASVVSARADATARLEALELSVARRMREAASVEAANARLQAIEAAGLDDRRASAAVADLDWAASARAPNARIESLIKADGVLAAEARGEDAPFQAIDRKIERYERPIRRGVWLWTIGDAPAGESR